MNAPTRALYLATMNDGLFIIDQPPRPAPVDHVNPNAMPDVNVIAALQPVVASNILAIGHAGTDLFVAFKSGGAYRYEGVPVETFDAMRAAKSAGSYLHANIKGKFGAVKVDSATARPEAQP